MENYDRLFILLREIAAQDFRTYQRDSYRGWKKIVLYAQIEICNKLSGQPIYKVLMCLEIRVMKANLKNRENESQSPKGGLDRDDFQKDSGDEHYTSPILEMDCSPE